MGIKMINVVRKLHVSTFILRLPFRDNIIAHAKPRPVPWPVGLVVKMTEISCQYFMRDTVAVV
jgi:hypothetical protein